MCTLFLPYCPGLSLLTHHWRGGAWPPPPCVSTAGAPLRTKAKATASDTYGRLMSRLLGLSRSDRGRVETSRIDGLESARADNTARRRAAKQISARDQRRRIV